MSEIRQLIMEIMRETYLLSLGTVDAGGVWVSDLVFVHDDDLNLYWLSKEDTRRSRAIAQNPNVAGSITQNTSRGEPNIGLQLEGVAAKLEGDVLEIASRLNAKKDKPAPQMLGEIFDPGEIWYRLVSRKIELIYEPKFGYQKQVLDLSADSSV